MKKKFIVIIIVILAVFTYMLYMTKSKKNSVQRPPLSIGYEPPSFIIGMKDSTIYELQQLFGQYTVVLVFMDDRPPSQKLLDLIDRKISLIRSSPGNAIWFSLVSKGSTMVIRELTDVLSLKYRTGLNSMPKSYSFQELPTTVVIDKTGIVKMIYSGYSPTFAEDILTSVKGK